MTRDFAFIVPSEVTADALVRAIRGSDKAAITSVRLFDRFETPDGLSLAFEVTMQPADKSFTEEELAAVIAVVASASGAPAEPREAEQNLWGHPVDRLRYNVFSWQRVTLMERTHMRK